jgi:hypothetical protein
VSRPGDLGQASTQLTDDLLAGHEIDFSRVPRNDLGADFHAPKCHYQPMPIRCVWHSRLASLNASSQR